MKQTKMSVFRFGIVNCLFLLFVSCATIAKLSCPYVISNPRVELSDDSDDCSRVVMCFSLANESKKSISGFSISFSLYDSDGNNPFVGSNCFIENCECELADGDEDDFSVALDSYLSELPDEPYQVDAVYLREIRYSDGTVWKDPYGMYCVRENYD